MAKENAKRQLATLSKEELLTYTRELRGERRELRQQLKDALENVSALEIDNYELKNQVVQQSETNRKLRDTLEDTQEQLTQALDNNSKLQGVVEHMPEVKSLDLSESPAFEMVIERLDTIIVTLGGEVPNTNGRAEYADDDDDDDDSDLSPPADFDDDDDDDDDDDTDDTYSVQAGDVEIPDEPSTVIEAVENALNAEAAVANSENSMQKLADLVVPVIKEAVDNFANYEDVILGAIRTGLSKELALRQVVAMAYPEHPEMADTILASDEVRNRVYEVMGV